MDETFSEEFVDPFVHPISKREYTDGVPAPDASFLKLLVDLDDQRSTIDDRGKIVVAYQAWINQNSGASTATFAAWFNLGVELSGSGDEARAIDAYHNALRLRPDFYPAAINLGILLEAAGQSELALVIWQQALQSEASRAALLELRGELSRAEQQDKAKVLHVGCGAYSREKLPLVFCHTAWREIRSSPRLCRQHNRYACSLLSGSLSWDFPNVVSG